MTKATRAGRTSWIILVSLVSEAAVWAAFASQYVDSHQMYSACHHNVPDTAAFVGENSHVAMDVTFLPIGRACAYAAIDGGTVTAQTGQAVTVAAFLGTAVCVIAIIAAWARWRQLTPMQRLFPAIALLYLVLGWTAIWLLAAAR